MMDAAAAVRQVIGRGQDWQISVSHHPTLSIVIAVVVEQTVELSGGGRGGRRL